jgi:flagellar biosynthesis anti-sigma factor FlgM
MPEPIQGVRPTGPLEIASAGQPGAAPTQQGSPPSRSGGAVDSADVARAEALLASIAEASTATPTTDAALISQLQRAIQSGTYQVNPQQIAEKIFLIEQLLAPRATSE